MKPGGYGCLPNCLPDVYMRLVSDVQYKVLECISRKTLGWHERWDAIPLSQFEDMMGSSRPAIVRAIKELREAKIILCGKGQGRSASQYALNSGFDTFELMVKHFNQLSKLTSNAELLLVVKEINCYASVVVTESYTQKTVPKDTIKTTIAVAVDIDPENEPEPYPNIKSDQTIIEGLILAKYRAQIMDRPPSQNALRDALEKYPVDQLEEAIGRMPLALKESITDGNGVLGLACKAIENGWWVPDDGGNGGVSRDDRAARELALMIEEEAQFRADGLDELADKMLVAIEKAEGR